MFQVGHVISHTDGEDVRGHTLERETKAKQPIICRLGPNHILNNVNPHAS
jgi:hypothetical protein